MDKLYLKRRQEKNYTSYRMNKRTEAIINLISEIKNDQFNSILDVGTADGKILSSITDYFDFKCAVGIDTSRDAVLLANRQKNKRIKVFLGNLLSLPFKDCIFDVLVASAVLEHITDIDTAVMESHRVLKDGGLLCVTLPNPFYDLINTLFTKTYHVKRYTLKQIGKILKWHNFEVIKSGYFMLWPFGRLPFEEYITRMIRFMSLDFLLFNQLILVRKNK